MNRRQCLLGGLGIALSPLASAAQSEHSGYAPPGAKQPLDISDYQPQSMLHVQETRVERSRFPVIDIHSHLGWSRTWQKGIPISEEVEFFAPAETLVPVMDRRNVRLLVNLTGSHGRGLHDSIAAFDRKYPNRFLTSQSRPGTASLIGITLRSRLTKSPARKPLAHAA